MNCCDDYGKCQQNDNCPARERPLPEIRYVKQVSDRGLGMLIMIGSALFSLSIFSLVIYFITL